MKYLFYLGLTMISLARYADASTSTPSPLCPYPSDDFTRFPYSGDCSKYWECFEGQRYPMSCPDGFEFNAETTVCDFPETAKCDADQTVTYPTFPHTTGTTTIGTGPTSWTPDPICPYPSNDLTFVPHPSNCSLYWECYQGIKYLMGCPSGLVFNIIYKYCDYPANVDCSHSTTTIGTEPTSWTPDPICPYPSEDLTFVSHSSNCSLYWECYQGLKYLVVCESGLVFNIVNKYCDYPANVDCSHIGTTEDPEETTTRVSTTEATEKTTSKIPVTITTQESTTPENTICINVPDGTFLSNTEDCRKFYECLYGKAIEGTCPLHLLWNEEKRTCDYSQNVICDKENGYF